MRLQHYVLIFLALLVGFFFFYRYQNQLSVSFETNNKQYADALTEACYDAAKTIKVSNLADSSGVWRTKEDKEHTLNIFYETLSRNFELVSELNEDKLKQMTPFVILLDIDGFYISFNGSLDSFDNAIVPASFEKANVITDINTYSESIGSSLVRYYLNDYVEVTTQNNKIFKGDRLSVYSDLVSSGLITSNLSFLSSKTEFDKRKNSVITNKLEKEINYFANTQICNENKYFTGYNITLSEVKGEDFTRLIKNPSVISFLQGENIHFGGKPYNVYAYAAGEMTNKTMYFIEGGYYYPYDGNVIEAKTTKTVNGVLVEVTTYTHNGNVVDNVYTLEQCVRLGAIPAY